ncbi:MAG: hypothetical protein ACE5EY_10845 [Anaerolineae bacterium]
MRKLLLLTAGLFAGLASVIPHFIKVKRQQHILAATVRISMTTPNWQQMSEAIEEALPIPPDEYRTMARADGNVVAEGLGTLVAQGDETLLVTHDHWSRFDETLGTVTFRAADGLLITEMDLRAFKQHLRYRDGGMMVLAAPEVLVSAVPGSLRFLSSAALQNGDSVFLAQRADNRVMLTEAYVVDQIEKQGRPAVRLQSASGQTVVGGDSGGGVWINGRLAAIMWTRVMMEDLTTGERQVTDLSVAALYDRKPR